MGTHGVYDDINNDSDSDNDDNNDDSNYDDANTSFDDDHDDENGDDDDHYINKSSKMFIFQGISTLTLSFHVPVLPRLHYLMPSYQILSIQGKFDCYFLQGNQFYRDYLIRDSQEKLVMQLDFGQKVSS